MNSSNAPHNRSRKSVIAGLLITLLLLLGSAEIGLRLFTSETMFLSPKTDDYWKSTLQTRLAKTGASGLLPDDLTFDEQLGWRMKPGYSGDGVHHNNRGYRATPETAADDPAPRILLLGDSFTYGLGVRDEETYGRQLAAITGANVINTGVAAHSIDQSLLLWKTEGKAMKPQTVVLGYAVDKFFTNPLTVRNLPKPWFSLGADKQSLTLHGTPIPPPEKLAQTTRLERPFSLRLVEATRWLVDKVKTKLGMGADYSAQAQLSDALLEKLNKSVHDAGADLIVAFIGHCYDGERDNLIAEQHIMNSCDKLGLKCIDIAAEMRKGDLNSYYGGNCHWSAAGHQFAAKKIAALITNAH